MKFNPQNEAHPTPQDLFCPCGTLLAYIAMVSQAVAMSCCATGTGTGTLVAVGPL